MSREFEELLIIAIACIQFRSDSVSLVTVGLQPP